MTSLFSRISRGFRGFRGFRSSPRRAKLCLATGVCILLALIFELLFANANRLFVYDPERYPEIDPTPYCTEESDSGVYRLSEGERLTFEDVPHGVFSVTFDVRYRDESHKAAIPVPKVELTVKDPRTSWDRDGIVPVSTEEIAVGEGGTSETVTLYASTVRDGAGRIELRFLELDSAVVIENLRVNAPPAWNFSALRFLSVALLLFLPFCFAITGLRRLAYDPQNPSHRVGVRTAVLFTVLIALLFSALFLPANEETPYPLKGAVRYYQPYIQQTDAFLKGQLHLDVPVPDELLDLENPYDYDSRVDADPLWDRAYYDGKYYSYFGVTPILLVYLPYYAVTGALPSDGFVMAVFLILSAIFIPLTVIKWVDLHEPRRIPIPLLWGGAVTAFVGSMMLLIARSVTPFYYIATLAGNALLSLFLFLLLKAAEADRLRTRCIFFALAGLSYALLFHARLNVALLAAFPVLGYLVYRVLKRREPLGESEPKRGLSAALRAFFEAPKPLALSLLSLGLPVAVGLGAALVLNAARFGSPFEFGTSYQLTVSDVGYNTLSLANLFPAIYHYFFQSLQTSAFFPFLSLGRYASGDYGHYVYIDVGLGLFSLPLMKLLLLSPAAFFLKRRPTYEKVLLALVLIGLLTVALLNFSLGGVIFRYTADLTTLAAITSVLVSLTFYSALTVKETDAGTEIPVSGAGEPMAYAAVTVFFALAAVAALLLSVSYNANLTRYPADLFVALKDFFTFG